MSNLAPSNYRNIINIIDDYKAGGVNYIVELKEYFSSAIAFLDTSYYEQNESILTASPVVTAGFLGF
jgi:hypothetical protein